MTAMELKNAIIQNSNQIDRIIQLIESTDIEDIEKIQKQFNMLIRCQQYQLWLLEKLEDLNTVAPDSGTNKG